MNPQAQPSGHGKPDIHDGQHSNHHQTQSSETHSVKHGKESGFHKSKKRDAKFDSTPKNNGDFKGVSDPNANFQCGQDPTVPMSLQNAQMFQNNQRIQGAMTYISGLLTQNIQLNLTAVADTMPSPNMCQYPLVPTYNMSPQDPSRLEDQLEPKKVPIIAQQGPSMPVTSLTTATMASTRYGYENQFKTNLASQTDPSSLNIPFPPCNDGLLVPSSTAIVPSSDDWKFCHPSLYNSIFQNLQAAADAKINVSMEARSAALVKYKCTLAKELDNDLAMSECLEHLLGRLTKVAEDSTIISLNTSADEKDKAQIKQHERLGQAAFCLKKACEHQILARKAREEVEKCRTVISQCEFDMAKVGYELNRALSKGLSRVLHYKERDSNMENGSAETDAAMQNTKVQVGRFQATHKNPANEQNALHDKAPKGNKLFEGCKPDLNNQNGNGSGKQNGKKSDSANEGKPNESTKDPHTGNPNGGKRNDIHTAPNPNKSESANNSQTETKGKRKRNNRKQNKNLRKVESEVTDATKSGAGKAEPINEPKNPKAATAKIERVNSGNNIIKADDDEWPALVTPKQEASKGANKI